MTRRPPDPLMEAAVRYALDAGWPVFPLKPRSKAPLTRHGFKDATTDLKQIETWWTKHPDANIGVPTGAVSGVVVLDLDGPAARAAIDELGAAIPTLTSVTGRGHHLFYQHPGGRVKNRTKILPDVDVRGDDGYVVAPPSVHPSGHDYHWDEERDLGWGTALAPMPPTLLRALTVEPTAILNFSSRGTIIPEGERNVRLTEIAGSFASRASTFDEVFDQLCDTNERRCRPPLPKSEVAAIVKSIWRRESSQLRGRRGKPLPPGPNVVFAVDWSQLHLDTSKDLADLGYLLDLGRFIAANASMPIKTGKRTTRPAWVGNGRAEIAIRFLTNRWGLGEKTIRTMIERWKRANLVQVHPPLHGRRQKQIEFKGWVQFDRGVGRPFPPEVDTPLDTVTHSHNNEMPVGTPPTGADLSARKGQQYTSKEGRGRMRWIRISPHLEVQMMVKKAEVSA